MENVYKVHEQRMIEEEARRWLIKLDGDDELGPQEIEALREWVRSSPAHRSELQRIAAFWDNANILTQLAIPLESRVQSPSMPGPGWFERLFRPAPGLRWASVIAVLCLLAIVLVPIYRTQQFMQTNGDYVSTLGEIRQQTLADGSVVILNTDSEIQVQYTDDARRVTLLRGEAHFEVASNADWPFEVYAGTGMVKAVGTAFAVRLKQDTVTVTVSEGRVDLATLVTAASVNGDISAGAEAGQDEALRKIGSIGLGQIATFSSRAMVAENSDNRGIDSADLPAIATLTEQQMTRKLAWREGYLVFSGDPLGDVVDEFNRYVPTKIEIVDPGLSEIRVGGRFKVGELDALLEALESGFNIQVSRLSNDYVQLRAAP